MTVLAFDCDGSLSLSAGPIPIEALAKLQQVGYRIIIVSPSPACAALSYDRVVVGITRAGLLLQVKHMYPDTNYVYTGDQPSDQQAAQEAGFTFYWAKDFMTAFAQYLR